MSRFTRRLLSREVDVLQTHRDQLARRAATRVLRAMAGVTRQRTLPTLAQTLRDYADKANNSGARRFRAGSFMAAVERRLQWGFGRTRPLLDEFLRRDDFGDGERPEPDVALPADGAGDPYCPRPPPAEELAALTLGVAARLPPVIAAGAAATRARRMRSRLRRHSASRDFEPPKPAEIRRALEPVVASLGVGDAAGVVAAVGVEAAPARAVAAARAAATTLGCDADAVLSAVAGAEAVARQARDTCPPLARHKLEQSLRRTRGEGDCAGAVEALGVHAALGAGRAVVELWRTAAPLESCAEDAARRAADVALAEATLARAARDWRAFEAPGVEALLALRPRFVEARRRRELEAALGAEAQPPADDDDRIGPRRRTATEAPGPAVQVAVAARASAATATSEARLAVFVENLPGDATASEVAAAFERAGAVADVELFASAPAAATAATGGRRGAAPADSRAPYKLRLSAPTRSATAALVTFADEAGARAAAHPALRVFGVVVRKRPCRTTPASDLRSLFVHRLPPALGEDGLAAALGAALGDDLNVRVWRDGGLEASDHARLRCRTHDLALLAWRRLAASEFGPNLSWTQTAPFVDGEA